MSVCVNGEPPVETASMVVGVFEVVGREGAARVALFDDGSLVQVLPHDAMAIWPVMQVRHLVIEEYAAPPAAMSLRVHTSCARTLRLRGELPYEGLQEVLRLEERLAIG